MKEMWEAMMADPNVKDTELYKKSEKFGEVMDRLTAKIVAPCIDYANENGEDDERWAHTVLISLARATCKVLYSMQRTCAEEGKDIYEFYHDELLPLCKEIAYRESDEMVEMAERREKQEKKGGVPFELKKEVVLAIADPDMPVEEIIGKFFKKDITDEDRKRVADHIAKARIDNAAELQRVRELSKE